MAENTTSTGWWQKRSTFPSEWRKIRVRDRSVILSTIEQCDGGRRVVFETIARIIVAFEKAVLDIGNPDLSLWNGRIESRTGGFLVLCPGPELNQIPTKDVHSLLVHIQSNRYFKVYMFAVGRTDERAFTFCLDSAWTYTNAGFCVLLFQRINWAALALEFILFWSDVEPMMMVIAAVTSVVLSIACGTVLEVNHNNKLYLNQERIKHLWAQVIEEDQDVREIAIKLPHVPVQPAPARGTGRPSSRD
jgi:hypothetical protein